MAKPQHHFEALEERLAPIASGFGLELDSVIGVKESGMQIVRVIVEAIEPGASVDSEALADMSRAVSPILDEVDPVDGEYFLEVSTPGAERELVTPRHWQRQIGRLVAVKLKDATKLAGRVESATDSHAVLNVDGTPTTIEYTQVKKARPRVEFGSEE